MKHSLFRYLRYAIHKVRHWIWRITLWHGRALLRAGVVIVLLLSLAALSWQFWFIPRLDQYRPRIVAEISRAAGVKLDVGEIVGGWDGIRPQLTLRHVRTYDQYDLPALEFEQLDGALSWWSLSLGRLRFSHINLIAPELKVVHLQNGGWRVAGFNLQQEGTGGKSGMLDWLLKQDSLSIRNGRLLLLNESLASWSLELKQFNFSASQFFGKRRFNFSFLPLTEIGKVVSGEGIVSGEDTQHLEAWAGRVKFAFPDVDIARLHSAVSGFSADLLNTWPVVEEGRGRLELAFFFDKKVLTQVDADFAVQSLRLSHQNKTFDLPLFDATAHWQVREQDESLVIEAKQINTLQGVLARNGHFLFTKREQEREINLRNIDLAPLAAYIAWLPDPWAERLAGATLSGDLSNVTYIWQGPLAQPEKWSGEFSVRELDLRAPAWLPHLGKLDLNGSYEAGKAQLSVGSKQFELNWPEQFLEPIALNQLDSVFHIQRLAQGWEIQTPALQMVNAEVSVSLAALYRWTGEGLGYIDLSGNILQLPAKRVYAYLPRAVGDETLDWLKTSLRAGKATQGKALLRGELAQFPYANGEPGIFKITANASDVVLDYASGWPLINNINGDIRFEGNGMFIRADSGRIFGVQLDHVNTSIPDLSLDDPHVLIQGKAQGKAPDFLRFVAQSPVKEATSGFLDDALASGSMSLDLKLDIPINDADATLVQGDLQLPNNNIDLKGGIPPLAQAKGLIQFTESSLKLKEIKANALGGNVTVSGMTGANGVLKLALLGQADLKETAQFYSLPQAKRMSGKVAFKGELEALDEQYALTLRSDLLGAKVALPAPLGKTAAQTRALLVKVGGVADKLDVAFNYANLLNAALEQQGTQAMTGWINLGAQPAPLPQKKAGLHFIGGWPYLDVAAWQAITEGEDGATDTPINSVKLTFGKVSAWGQNLNALSLLAEPIKTGWSIDINSQEAAGHVEWNGGKQARLFARLSHLYLPLSDASDKEKPIANASKVASAVLASPTKTDAPFKIKPVLDLQIGDLRYKKAEFGEAYVQAQPNAQGWLLSDVRLENPDGKLSMTGQWFNSQGVNRTETKFTVDSANTGKLMARLGYVDALQRAPAQLSGAARWEGAPYAPNIATMQGSMRIDVKAGQFAKIDPGAGRLLSLISLQSLTRRIKLDFSDVYSEGLEFDGIAGDVHIENGIARTDNLEISSTSSRIGFKGEANLVAETQNIRVRIVPILGDAASLAVGAVNPIAGAAAFALGRIFKDPLGRLISYEYEITGEMQNPQINKVK